MGTSTAMVMQLCFLIFTSSVSITIEIKQQNLDELAHPSQDFPVRLHHLENACQAFGDVIAKVLDLAGNPLAAEAIHRFTDVVVRLLDNLNKDMWTAIEERLESRIDSRITKNHFGTMVSKIRMLQEFMRPESKLTTKDLRVHIMTMKYQFLPQTFAFTAFDSKWATALPAFLTYMTAAHLQLIYEGKIDNCSLARELHTIRNETIQAAKALFRARYRGLRGIKSFKAWPKMPCPDSIICPRYTWLQYEDTATGTIYSEPLSKVGTIFERVYNHTTEFVWDQMVKRVNAFFTKEMCLCNEKCPKPIEKSEVTFPYPRACYGVSLKKNKTCTYPCDIFDDRYSWCPVYKNHAPPKTSFLTTQWEYCKKDKTFLQCMPVQGTKVFGFSSKDEN